MFNVNFKKMKKGKICHRAVVVSMLAIYSGDPSLKFVFDKNENK